MLPPRGLGEPSAEGISRWVALQSWEQSRAQDVAPPTSTHGSYLEDEKAEPPLYLGFYFSNSFEVS